MALAYRVAQGATIHVFTVRLADADRGVFESLELRVARHPSETAEYLLTRVLAYCLEYTEGIAFTKGLSDADEPAITVRDLAGALRSWIEVGAPEAPRLHTASKAAPRVAVYTHKDAAALAARLGGERIHRSEALEIYGVDRELLAALSARLERRMEFDLSVARRLRLPRAPSALRRRSRAPAGEGVVLESAPDPRAGRPRPQLGQIKAVRLACRMAIPMREIPVRRGLLRFPDMAARPRLELISIRELRLQKPGASVMHSAPRSAAQT